MRLKTTLAILALALAPALAAAQCADHGRSNISASACGDAQVWDTETQSCVPKPSS